MFTHCTLTIHSSYTHCTLIVHSSYTHCTIIVHSLYTHCTLIVHSSYTHCTLVVHSSYTHCIIGYTHNKLIVQSFFIFIALLYNVQNCMLFTISNILTSKEFSKALKKSLFISRECLGISELESLQSSPINESHTYTQGTSLCAPSNPIFSDFLS